MHKFAQLALLSTALALPSCGTKTEATTPGTPTPQAPAAGQPTVPPVKTPAATPPVASQAAPTVADLPKLLETITDGPTAQLAKGKLESLIATLKNATNTATSGQLGSDLGKLAGAAAAKAGVDVSALKSAALTKVQSLLTNETIKGAIGPTLEQLVALLK
jgi:hypothetical protein